MKRTQKTHKLISEHLVGKVSSIKKNQATVALLSSQEMIADQYGLIHGGFIFGLADYVAMLAVNKPNVVLGKAEIYFLKPVKVNEKLIANAKVKKQKDNKYTVEVHVLNQQNDTIFSGEFICFDLKNHVLKNKNK